MFLQIDQFNTGCDSSEYGNPRTFHTDHDTICVDDHNLIIRTYCLCTDYISGLLCDLIAFHAFSTTVLGCEFFHAGSLAHTLFRYDQKLFTLRIKLHCNNFITVT